MIEEAAKRLYEIAYRVRQFAIKHPNSYMPEKWGDLPDEIKANYCEDAQQICQLFEPEEEESTVKLPQVVGLGGEANDEPKETNAIDFLEGYLEGSKSDEGGLQIRRIHSWAECIELLKGVQAGLDMTLLSPEYNVLNTAIDCVRNYRKIVSIKDARYRQAVKDSAAGKPLDLTEEEFGIFCAIENMYIDKISKVKDAVIEGYVQLLEDRNREANMLIKSNTRLRAECQARITELWDDVICSMCYRLNPQHATMDNGEGCHWCQDREDWQALKEGYLK